MPTAIFLTKNICYFRKKYSIFVANKIKDMERIYEFSFIPKRLAYMVKDNTERYWYLYIRKNEAGIVAKTNKGFYIYDYNKCKNIYAGENMLGLSIAIKRIYRLYNNVSRGTINEY